MGQEYKTEVHSMMMKEVDTMTASIKANIRRLQRKIKELLQKTKAIASGMVCLYMTFYPRSSTKLFKVLFGVESYICNDFICNLG